ncbi:hypothetical protein BJ978_001872 [Agromyces terreus]|uniref:Uncharacterized protein n=1 Tax=Agromyces terreus TaxID=424795 RepID=A0A9X2H110_9MICO|nr:hypothetical protein [Agromyces terreus]MCP2371196.1 hypothetical protein [Agromyces terreus]
MATLIEREGRIEAWVWENGQPLLIFEQTTPCSAALTSQRIAGLHYYALEVESGDDQVLLTLGTSWTSGHGVASRKAHLRFAQSLVDARIKS